jgi:hypothetical protein
LTADAVDAPSEVSTEIKVVKLFLDFRKKIILMSCWVQAIVALVKDIDLTIQQSLGSDSAGKGALFWCKLQPTRDIVLLQMPRARPQPNSTSATPGSSFIKHDWSHGIHMLAHSLLFIMQQLESRRVQNSHAVCRGRANFWRL